MIVAMQRIVYRKLRVIDALNNVMEKLFPASSNAGSNELLKS